MPYGDRTGPAGAGPMTGRGAGYCAGYSAPGFASAPGGRGFNRFGRGRGFRNRYWATGYPGRGRFSGYREWEYPEPAAAPPFMQPGKEADLLKRQAEFMQNDLDEIHRRIEELEKTNAEKKQ